MKNNNVTSSSYWKLNKSLLLHDKVQRKIKNLITSFWIKAKAENAFSTNWEILKYEIGKYVRKFVSLMATKKKEKKNKNNNKNNRVISETSKSDFRGGKSRNDGVDD